MLIARGWLVSLVLASTPNPTNWLRTVTSAPDCVVRPLVVSVDQSTVPQSASSLDCVNTIGEVGITVQVESVPCVPVPSALRSIVSGAQLISAAGWLLAPVSPLAHSPLMSK